MTTTPQAPVTAEQLASHVAAVLGVPRRSVDPDRPLTALGLEARSALRLQHHLRTLGAGGLSLRRLLDGGSARSIAALLARDADAPDRSGAAPVPDTSPRRRLVPLDAGLAGRLSACAEEWGLTRETVLYAAALLTVARWTCGTGWLEVRLEADGRATGTVRATAPDPLRWSGFGAYARELSRAAHTPAEALHPSAGAARVVFAVAPAEQTGTPPLASPVLAHRLDHSGPALVAVWELLESDGADAAFLTGLGDAYGTLLAVLAADPLAWRRVDLGWAPTFTFQEPLIARPFPDAGPLLDDPLHAAARRSPDAPALLGSSGALTHGELAAHAAVLAGRLAAAGVRPGDPVAVALPKCSDQIVAVAATARCGAVYVPVDPGWPASRIAAVCRRSGLAHALVAADTPTGADARAELPAGVTRVPVDTGDDAAAGPLCGDAGHCPGPGEPAPRTAPDSRAYIIFTSGSTGEPKGVVVDHSAARVTVDDITDRLGVGPSDRVLGLSALSFDLSVYDIFGVLGAGGALVLPDPDGERDPQHWMDLVERHRVTLWNTAPALMQMVLDLAEADPGSAARQLAPLRRVLLSGDWIPVTLPDRLRALVPDVQVISAGGATEAAIWSICHPVGEVPPEWRSIPYGRPLREQFFHVLDDEGRPQPVGRAGELHIAGRGLARGYAGDEEQTAARFPVHPVLRERVYRTGDLGMWRTDGTIEFLGRRDRQVKIRGHRIELGEIESVLDRLPDVRRAVASVTRGSDGRQRLLAHAALTPQALLRDADTVREELKGALERSLPAYMVPHHIALTDALPVTANGKIDHARLARIPAGPHDPDGPADRSACPIPSPAAEIDWASQEAL